MILIEGIETALWMFLAFVFCSALALSVFLIVGFILACFLGYPRTSAVVVICLFALYQLELLPFYVSPPGSGGFSIAEKIEDCHPENLVRFPQMDRGPFQAYIPRGNTNSYSHLTILEFKRQWFGNHLWRISHWRRDYENPNHLTLTQPMGGWEPENQPVEHMVFRRFIPLDKSLTTLVDKDPVQVIDIHPGESLYSLRPGDPGFTPPFDPTAAYSQHIQNGLAAIKAQQYDMGIAEYTEAMKLDWRKSLAYNARGNCYRLMRQYDLALQDFKISLELPGNYHDQETLYNRAVTFMEMRRYKKAIDDYTTILDEGMSNLAHYNRAVCYANLGDYDDALVDCQTLIDAWHGEYKEQARQLAAQCQQRMQAQQTQQEQPQQTPQPLQSGFRRW